MAEKPLLCIVHRDTPPPQPPKPDPEDWPKTARTREELDAAIAKGLASPRSLRTFDEIIANAMKRLDSK